MATEASSSHGSPVVSRQIGTTAYVRPPGIGWLIGWTLLLWFGLALAPLLHGPLYESVFPDPNIEGGVRWSREWIRSVGTYVGHLALARGAVGGITGLVFGTTASVLLRKHVPHARWLPLLGAAGLAVGESNGVIVSWTWVVFGDTLVLTDPDRFLLRQSLIHNAVSGAGLALVMGYVLRRQLPHYGWWVAACSLAFVLKDLPVVIASNNDAGFGVRGVLILLVGLPLASFITGASTLALLKIRDRERRSRCDGRYLDDVVSPPPPT